MRIFLPASISAVIARVIITIAMVAFVSAGGAQEWSQPLPLNSYANIDSEIPDSRVQVATDGASDALSVWLENASGEANDYTSIYLARSSNSGASWSAPQLLFEQSQSHRQLLAATVIHLSGDTWLTAWPVEDTVDNTDHVYVTKTTNNGQTWSTPQVVISKQLWGAHDFFRLSMDTDDGGDTIVASGRGQIIRSGDAGATWNHIEIPETYGGTGARVAYAGDGKWANVFSRSYFVNLDYHGTDVYKSLSADNGLTWTVPDPITIGGYNLGAPFYLGPYLRDMAADGSTILMACGSSQSLLSIYRSVDGGTSWTKQANIPGSWIMRSSEVSLAIKGAKAVVVSDLPENGYGTVLRYSFSSDAGTSWIPTATLGVQPDPQTPYVAATGNGNFILNFDTVDRPVGYHVLRQVHSARTVNGQLVFIDVQELNAGASGQLDQIIDQSPDIAEGANGTMVAVWNVVSQYGDSFVGHIARAVSLNYGQSWGPAAVVGGTYGTNGSVDISPKVVYNGQGRWFGYWQEGEVTFGTVSVDNGVSWSFPADIATGPGFEVLGSDERGTMLAKSASGYWRSDNSGSSWTSPSGASYGVGAFYLGSNSWIKFEQLITYTSHDNGVTWTQTGELYGAYPVHNMRIDRSDDGTLGIIIHYNGGCFENQCAGPLSVARSTDNGVTWVQKYFVSGAHIYDGLTFNANINIAWLGGQKWIASWGTTVATSDDNMQSWSEPAPFSTTYGFGNAVMAAADGHATAVWDGGGPDSDIFFSNLAVPSPAAAADWNLFE